MRSVSFFILPFSVLLWVFLSPFSLFAATIYTPATMISMTGSNGEVFFDVADDLFGYPIPRPSLDTTLRTFSWAFYLSGAGWVDFSTGSYSVELDCGVQSFDALSLPCTLSWVAYGEVVGDVSFDRYVTFDPTTWLLSWTASTYLWVYDFSGIALPLMPASFIQGNRVTADHEKNLTLSGIGLSSGISPWNIHIETIPWWINIPYTLGTPTDLSHASSYRVEITDPDGGTTIIDDFEVIAALPSSMLSTATPTVRQDFCTANPLSLLCPDGAILRPMSISPVQTATPMIANGVDSYRFTLKLRDRYGNEIREGSIRVDYRDSIRTIQVDPLKYMEYYTDASSCIFPYCSLIETSLYNDHFGNPNTGLIPLPSPSITYSFASITPTSLSDSLSLSGIIYTDALGVSTDIADPLWKAPLTFDPWYTTSIIAPPSLIVWSVVDFTTTYAHTTSAPWPTLPTAIYDISIGINNPASFTGFTSSSTILCTKYYMSLGSSECNWWWSPDPVIVSTEALSFSGLYGYGGYEPPPETVNYRSYIRYSFYHPLLLTNIVSLYPSASGPLGTSVAGTARMKILGQHNLPSISGIQEKNIANIWNTLRKNIALLSRNRTLYDDVPYKIVEGDITLSDADFSALPPEKHTIVSVWWDITITSDISKREYPLALIALTNSSGSGWDIIVGPNVTDIYATLMSEKSLHSTWANQLYIYGSAISHNTTSDSTCPYYISPCVNPEFYNLENLRKGFLLTPGIRSSALAGKYATIPLVIEYDGRVLTDPPPILDK